MVKKSGDVKTFNTYVNHDESQKHEILQRTISKKYFKETKHSKETFRLLNFLVQIYIECFDQMKNFCETNKSEKVTATMCEEKIQIRTPKF